MRSILLEVPEQVRAAHTLKKVVQIGENLRVHSHGHRPLHRNIEACHNSVLVLRQCGLCVVIAVQLGGDVDVFCQELELVLATLSEHLHHQVVKLLGVHRFEYLIFHMTSGLP